MANAYEKIQALKAKHPDKTMTALFEMAKVQSSSYYGIQAKMRKAEKADGRKKPRAKYTKLVAEAPADIGKVMLVYGTPDQVKAVIGAIQ